MLGTYDTLVRSRLHSVYPNYNVIRVCDNTTKVTLGIPTVPTKRKPLDIMQIGDSFCHPLKVEYCLFDHVVYGDRILARCAADNSKRIVVYSLVN